MARFYTITKRGMKQLAVETENWERIAAVIGRVLALEARMTVTRSAVSVIVISDFLDDAGCEKALQYLADYGNELMLVQLWTDEDRMPPWNGEVDLTDAESGGRLRIQVDDDARRRYTEAFDASSAGIKEVALRNEGKYHGSADFDAIGRSDLRFDGAHQAA